MYSYTCIFMHDNYVCDIVDGLEVLATYCKKECAQHYVYSYSSHNLIYVRMCILYIRTQDQSTCVHISTCCIVVANSTVYIRIATPVRSYIVT